MDTILQPAVASDASVVGLAITAATTVAGCATGASHAVDIEAAARLAVETAKGFDARRVALHDAEEFALLVSLYGENTRLQGLGGAVEARGQRRGSASRHALGERPRTSPGPRLLATPRSRPPT